jgi:hypothetical protein
MGNNLTNSFVRGFGWGLGRSAASAITSKKRTIPVPEQQSFSSKQLALIQENEAIREKVLKILNDAEVFYTKGEITEKEYIILKSQATDQLLGVDDNIRKLKSVSEPKKGSPWIFITLVVIAIWVIVKLSH